MTKHSRLVQQLSNVLRAQPCLSIPPSLYGVELVLLCLLPHGQQITDDLQALILGPVWMKEGNGEEGRVPVTGKQKSFLEIPNSLLLTSHFYFCISLARTGSHDHFWLQSGSRKLFLARYVAIPTRSSVN